MFENVLPDASVDLHFDRVFDGHDVPLVQLDRPQQGVERRRLARTRRARHEHHPRVLLDLLGELVLHPLGHLEVR
jgi:hypothetical protein